MTQVHALERWGGDEKLVSTFKTIDILLGFSGDILDGMGAMGEDKLL